ncbi:erythromycin esterase family protein [Aurantibacter crassamenti]|uniref:erythromycin esterase family protein n=1 Tax=Aurantibacter crassamenti TaxID=1837375 RepID=UPI00193A3335|nr:erythromycin esterase family protein [Aurantibacter crassamenti]MBM1107681.1 erythromycin esterase family protein [Aurantibacter crassamenti]
MKSLCTNLSFFVFLLFLNTFLSAQDQVNLNKTKTSAQDKFNLNFNVIDSTKNLPKGWFKWGYYDLAAEKKQGFENFAGKVVSDKKGKFGCITYRIPANYVGDSIQLTGYIKVENVKKGNAGLLMRIDGYGKHEMLAFANMSKQNVNGTADWKKYSIKLPFSNRARTIFIGGILSGKGTAWFDDFVVTIDGKNIQNLEEVQKSILNENNKNEVKESIEKNYSALDITNDETLDESLNSLIKSIGTKKIISVGEDTHGTSEFYKLREAITKKLILEQGFNTIVLESPYDDIEVLNQNLQTVGLDTLMQKHLFSIYQTQEMKHFLEWYKTSGVSNKVKFKGCDDSYWEMSNLLNDDLKENASESIRILLDDFNEKSSLTYKEYSKKHKRENTKPKNENELRKMAYESILAIEKQLGTENMLSDKRKEYLFNAKNSYINYVNVVQEKALQSRDEIMSDRISYLANDPQAKIIVWAHNAHISNTVIIDNEIGIMGHDLKQEFGDKYHAIGLSSLNGSYSYMENKFINDDHDYSDRLLNTTLKHQPKNSWESIFNQIETDAYYMNMATVKKELNNDALFGSLKLIGYGEEKESDYYFLSPLDMFDTLIFIKRTLATTPLVSATN